MSCLSDHSELDGAREVERRDREHGQDLDEVRVAHCEELEVALRGEEGPLVLDGAAEARAHLVRVRVRVRVGVGVGLGLGLG